MRKCINGCMSKDTRITMGDGGEKLISEIQIGDIILLSTGEKNRISNILMGTELDMLKIEINNSSLVVTGEHPILLDEGNWSRAIDLNISDVVRTQNGLAKVISIQRISYNDTVYNVCLLDENKDEGIFANGFVVGDMNRQYRMQPEVKSELSYEMNLLVRELSLRKD